MQGEQGPSYAHPAAAFFLFFFKAAAVVIYIFCGWFGTDFVINFCVITFLLVCDFWTVGWVGGGGRRRPPPGPVVPRCCLAQHCCVTAGLPGSCLQPPL